MNAQFTGRNGHLRMVHTATVALTHETSVVALGDCAARNTRSLREPEGGGMLVLDVSTMFLASLPGVGSNEVGASAPCLSY